MIGSIDDPSVLTNIGVACGVAAGHVRERVTRGAHRRSEGQADTREEGATEDLADAIEDIDALGDLLSQTLNTKTEEAGPEHKPVRIEFRTEMASQGEEKAFGLDLGIRVIIETPGYSAQKAILVQCKRMSGLGARGVFKKLRGDGERQARDMLRITPASFFFLFNGGTSDELLAMMRRPYPLLREIHESPPWPLEYYNPGVTVLSAARVLAMSEGAKGGPLPIGAPEVLRASVPFGEFIAGLFAPCLVGDLRLPLLQLATPPTRRNEIVGGVEAEVPELGTLQPNRYFEFRFSKEGDARDREHPRKRKG